MTLSAFPTFLTFLTQALCFPVPASDPWRGLEVPPYARRERLGPETVGPEANDLTGRPESASEVAMAPSGASRLGAAMTCSSTASGTRPALARQVASRRLGPKGDPMPAPDHIGERYGDHPR